MPLFRTRDRNTSLDGEKARPLADWKMSSRTEESKEWEGRWKGREQQDGVERPCQVMSGAVRCQRQTGIYQCLRMKHGRCNIYNNRTFAIYLESTTMEHLSTLLHSVYAPRTIVGVPHGIRMDRLAPLSATELGGRTSEDLN